MNTIHMLQSFTFIFTIFALVVIAVIAIAAAIVCFLDIVLDVKEDERIRRLNAAMKVLLLVFALSLTGCTVVTNDRVFPKLVPYWSAEAKQQRNERKPTLPANPSTETQTK